MTLASCGNSGTASRTDLRQTFAIPQADKECFEKKLTIPEGGMTRVQVLDLLKRAKALDTEKTVCGRAVIARYETLLETLFDDEGNTQ
jgi:hypothetical protein